MVAVLPRDLDKVEGGGDAAGKAQPELFRALHIEIPHLLGGAVHRPVQGAPARQVHGAEDQGLIHGQIKAAVALDAPHIPQPLAESLAQGDADVLGGVVIIHLHVPVAGEHQVKPAVPGKQFQHVVQKAAAGVHLIDPRPVQIQGQIDLGLGGVAFHSYFPHGVNLPECRPVVSAEFPSAPGCPP